MKKFSLFVLFTLLCTSMIFAVPETSTEKIKVEGKNSAYIYITQIYASEYWAEFFVVYEESSNTFNEADTEKILYEFISKYKLDHNFSRVEVEDLEAARETEKLTRVTKRVIFRKIRK